MEGVGEEKDDKREIEKNCYVTPLLLPSFLPSFPTNYWEISVFVYHTTMHTRHTNIRNGFNGDI